MAKELTQDQKAVAINLAMDLEEEQYNPMTMRGFVEEFKTKNTEDLRPLFDFWASTNAMTQRAYIAASFYMSSPVKV